MKLKESKTVAELIKGLESIPMSCVWVDGATELKLVCMVYGRFYLWYRAMPEDKWECAEFVKP